MMRGRFPEYALPSPRLPDLLSVAWLRARGWSRGMIVKFAGAPDAHGANPHAGGAAMKFYSRARIDEVEATPQFITALAAARRRKGKKPT